MRGVWWQKVRPFWQRAQWPLVWTLAAAALVLGYEGFSKFFGANSPRLEKLYLTLQLFVMESGAVLGASVTDVANATYWQKTRTIPWELETARWLAPAVTIYTATKAFIAIFQDQLTSLRLWFYRRHVVVCGLGRKGYLLCKAYRRQGERVVVIESDHGNEMIDRCREAGAVVLVGDAGDRAMLRQARVHKARILFSVVGDDGANAQAAGHARHLVRDKGGSLTCLVHIVEPQLRDLLSEREFLKTADDRFRMGFFNVYQEGARALLRSHPPFAAAAIDKTHLLVVGLGRMGQALVTQAAGEWYEAGFHKRRPLKITVVDRNPEAKIEAMRFRHPQVTNICDFEPWLVDVTSPQFQQGAPLFDAENNCKITSAYVCLDDDARGLFAGLALLRRLGGQPVSVIVRMMYGAGLSMLLQRDMEESAHRYSNLYSFNLLDQTCTEKIDQSIMAGTIASGIHADYVRWVASQGETLETNPYLAPWDELPETLRRKNLQHATHIRAKLAAIGCDVEPLSDGGVREFTTAELELMAQMGHGHWCELRRTEGWTYYNGLKDSVGKTSPHLVGWEKLPDKVRESNRRAARAIPDALAGAGLQVSRRNKGDGLAVPSAKA